MLYFDFNPIVVHSCEIVNGQKVEIVARDYGRAGASYFIIVTDSWDVVCSTTGWGECAQTAIAAADIIAQLYLLNGGSSSTILKDGVDRIV